MSINSKPTKPIFADSLFLLISSAIFLIAGLGNGSLASWDEAYYALVSKGIYLSGDWVKLTYFTDLFFDKPPLYFWITNIFYQLFGVTEFATRLCSAIAGVGTIYLTYRLGCCLVGRVAGLAGAGILISSTDFLHYARWGTLDITHLFFFTLTIYSVLNVREQPRYWLGFWIASALAVMTKGPLILLAWTVSIMILFVQRNISKCFSKYFFLGIGAFLLLVMPWHIAAYQINPEKFWHDFIYKHYVARTSQALEGHVGNYYYYIRTLINKYHPWVVLLPIAIFVMVENIIRNRNRFPALLFLVWTAIVLSFFTFGVSTKLKWYILPMYPAISLMIGWLMAGWFKYQHLYWIKAIILVALILHIPFSSVFNHDYLPALKSFSKTITKSVPADETIYLYSYHEEPGAKFYWERNIKYMDNFNELEDVLKTGGEVKIVMRDSDFYHLENGLREKGLVVLAQTKDYDPNLFLLSTNNG